MATITIPCEIGDIIYCPHHAAPIPAHLKVTQIRITQYGMIVDATNGRTGEDFIFPENAFGKRVFFEKEKEKAFEVAKAKYYGNN